MIPVRTRKLNAMRQALYLMAIVFTLYLCDPYPAG